MSYSAKIGDINGFDLDIIAMGTLRRAKAESERKALVNSEKYSEPGPRTLNGGMNTDDKLKAVAAIQIEKMYSTPVPVRKRAVPAACNAQRTSASKTTEIATPTRNMQTRALPDTHVRTAVHAPAASTRVHKSAENAMPKKNERAEYTQDQERTPPRQRRSKVYTAKKRPSGNRIITKKKKDKNSVPVGTVSAILIITVMLLYFVVLYIQKFELQDNIGNMNEVISEKSMTLATWETKLDEKNPSLDKIEQFATEHGMVRKTPDKYISVTPDEDIIEIYGEE